MTQTFNIAVVEASSLVGQTLLTLLAERKFPAGKVYALAQQVVEEDEAEFGRRSLEVEALDEFEFAKADLVFFAANAEIAATFAPKAVAAGCVVIDLTGQFNQESDVPLIIPEVNPEALAGYKARNIIANPASTTIQLLVALKSLDNAARITRINVATYQAVSGSGRSGIDELASQTAQLLNGRPVEARLYPKQIAFNVLPQVSAIQKNGYTFDEMQLVLETRKVLSKPALQVNPTAVTVPVFFGHSLAVTIETEVKLTASHAHELLSSASGVVLMDSLKDGGYPTAVTDAANEDAVLVGRIREDISHPQGLNLWVVADNTRKGAALNGVQIAELLVKDYW